MGEPKYKYGQHEQVTVRNHNRSTALERSALQYLGFKPDLRNPSLALSFCYGSKHVVSCSVRVKVQWIIIGNKNKSQTNTMMKQR